MMITTLVNLDDIADLLEEEWGYDEIREDLYRNIPRFYDADRIQKISDAYGYDAQSRQLIEELAELTQAVNKFWRKQLDCGKKEFSKKDEEIRFTEEYENMVEELADVQLMLLQMEYLLNADITEQMRDKVKRQMERLDERNSVPLFQKEVSK